MKSIIELHHLSKTYQIFGEKHCLLSNVSFSLGAGESCRLIAKKPETALVLHNILSLLEPPSSGIYLLDGRDVTRIPEDEATLLRMRSLGLLTQDRGLVPSMSLLENLRLPVVMSAPQPSDHPELDQEVFLLLSEFGMLTKLHWPCRDLSEEERCLAVLARELLKKPKVFLIYKFKCETLDTARFLSGRLKQFQREGGAILYFDDALAALCPVDRFFQLKL